MQVFILRENASIEERARALACQIAIIYKTPTRGTTFPEFPTKDWFTSDGKEILDWIGDLKAKDAERRLSSIAMSFAHSHDAGRQTRKRLMNRADAIYDFLSGNFERAADPVIISNEERQARAKSAREAKETQEKKTAVSKKKPAAKKTSKKTSGGFQRF
jgi:hypothetical protein